MTQQRRDNEAIKLDISQNKLGIRLVIPICEDDDIFDEYYCKHSLPDNFEIRKEILNFAMTYKKEGIDLVVTSNNFFAFQPNYLMEGRHYVEDYVFAQVQHLDFKKPLVVGFDIRNDRIEFNPYGGIEALVCFLEVISENTYKYNTHIWESWFATGNCDSASFAEQNEKRRFDYEGWKCCLLSCGDILGYCHNSGGNLPDADIYLGLAHMNFKKWSIKSKEGGKDEANIQKWKKRSNIVVIVTQQLSRKVVKRRDRNYLDKINDSKYQVIWPAALRNNQTVTMFNAEHLKICSIERRVICLLTLRYHPHMVRTMILQFDSHQSKPSSLRGNIMTYMCLGSYCKIVSNRLNS